MNNLKRLGSSSVRGQAQSTRLFELLFLLCFSISWRLNQLPASRFSIVSHLFNDYTLRNNNIMIWGICHQTHLTMTHDTWHVWRLNLTLTFDIWPPWDGLAWPTADTRSVPIFTKAPQPPVTVKEVIKNNTNRITVSRYFKINYP